MLRIFLVAVLVTIGLSSQAQVSDSLSYSLGASLGDRLKGQGATVADYDVFLQGVKDALNGNLAIDKDAVERINYEYFEKQRNQLMTKHKDEGIAFLAENGKRPEVTTTESGLQYEVLIAGEGEKPTATSTVTVHYEGKLLNGEKFDSSYDRGESISFPLNRVIAGWTEGLQLMSPGAKYRLYIPYNLAYGERGAGGAIPPFAALIFDVELLSFQ